MLYVSFYLSSNQHTRATLQRYNAPAHIGSTISIKTIDGMKSYISEYVWLLCGHTHIFGFDYQYIIWSSLILILDILVTSSISMHALIKEFQSRKHITTPCCHQLAAFSNTWRLIINEASSYYHSWSQALIGTSKVLICLSQYWDQDQKHFPPQKPTLFTSSHTILSYTSSKSQLHHASF